MGRTRPRNHDWTVRWSLDKRAGATQQGASRRLPFPATRRHGISTYLYNRRERLRAERTGEALAAKDTREETRKRPRCTAALPVEYSIVMRLCRSSRARGEAMCSSAVLWRSRCATALSWASPAQTRNPRAAAFDTCCAATASRSLGSVAYLPRTYKVYSGSPSAGVQPRDANLAA